MLPTGHVIFAATQVLETRRRRSAWFLALLIIVWHIPLDLVPHLEPSLFGTGTGEYLHPGSWQFFWTGADIGLSACAIFMLSRTYPSQRFLLYLAFWAALAPDLFTTYIQVTFGRHGFLHTYLQFHNALHWWRAVWSKPTLRIIGTVDWLGLIAYSLWRLHRLNSETVARENRRRLVEHVQGLSVRTRDLA